MQPLYLFTLHSSKYNSFGKPLVRTFLVVIQLAVEENWCVVMLFIPLTDTALNLEGGQEAKLKP